jgi:hypothetical protein
MIPYNHKIKSVNEVKETYSHIKDIDGLMKTSIVKKFITEEYLELYEDEKFYEGKVTPEKDLLFKEIAAARGLYRFLWGVDHITDQMISAGWNPKHIVILIKRVQRAGLDPYSTTNDTVDEFIDGLKGGGFIEKTIKGKTFHAYSPNGN